MRSAPAIARCPWRTTSSCSGSSLAPNRPPVSNSSKAVAPPDDRPRERVARRAGDRRDDRAARAGHSVEQRRFADVRAADEHDRRAFRGIVNVHLASALTA